MNKKIFDYLLITIGSMSILYFIILIMNMSFTSFLLIYPLLTFVSFSYAMYELKSKKSILQKFSSVPRYFIIGVVSLSIVFFCVVEVFLLTKGQVQTTQKSDYIVVLGAQVNGSKISSSLQYRLDAALDLHTQFPSTPIVVSGGKGPGENNSEAFYMKQYLIQKGVSEKNIIIEDKSRNTNENLTFTKKILDQKKKEYHITIVTNAFHTARAQLIADRLGLQASTYASKMHKVSIPHFYIREFFGFCKDFILLK